MKIAKNADNVAARTRFSSSRSIAVFYVLALGLTWGAWAPWVARARAGGALDGWRYLHLVGGLGPLLAALLTMAFLGGAGALRRFLAERLVSARGAGVALGWGLVFPTAIFLASIVVLGMATHTAPRWNRLGLVPEYPALGPVVYLLASFVFYGLGEEVGWRGFLYPTLGRTSRPWIAALLVVPFWALWHLPLFWATEGFRAMGPGGVAGWVLSLASGSLLTAWLCERAGGSVLPAAALHAILDVYFLADMGVPVQSVMGAAVTIWGVVVAVHGLRRRPPARSIG